MALPQHTELKTLTQKKKKHHHAAHSRPPDHLASFKHFPEGIKKNVTFLLFACCLSMVTIKSEWRGGATHKPPINTQAACDQGDLKKKERNQKRDVRGENFTAERTQTGLVERWKCSPRRVTPGWEGEVGRGSDGNLMSLMLNVYNKESGRRGFWRPN